MGSKSSKTSNEQEVKLKPQFWGFNVYQKNNNYDESFSTTQNTQSETTNISKSSSKKTIDKKCPFKFEWKGNGKSVLLSGSFLDNWTNTEILVKPGNGISYVIPQTINDKDAESITFKFRVRRPIQNVFVTFNEGEKEIAKFVRPVLIPSEMVMLKLNKDQLAKIEGGEITVNLKERK